MEPHMVPDMEPYIVPDIVPKPALGMEPALDASDKTTKKMGGIIDMLISMKKVQCICNRGLLCLACGAASTSNSSAESHCSA
ncbi:hypothetical protein PHYSODRAFT_329974 [Phytophthora sojae]|uniref:Uncharacterized protein n=1 Tax=Phytophthora sojae (strain P6497) TaxID=1094619 RepID=G4ZC89_PHYSP|nr:hypothetical protein PHYSODRAFT_329974 [Phytophthora sojae]EGZ22117.1 hypothetical protein PHYSODRAFT_329974 [Phytophthora sojae]|eukprot:XP_009524834.1 hypothetical protein PHYSODRAFT_329974 [Phytophthora sojae]